MPHTVNPPGRAGEIAQGSRGLERFADAILKISIFVAAMDLYFCGWMYIYEFYHFFGITFQASEIPFYSTFVYSFTVLFHPSNIAFVVAGTIAILWFAFLSLKSVKMRVYVWTCIIVALFPLTWTLSRRAALNNLSRIDELPVIEIAFRDRAATQTSLLDLNSSGGLRLILETPSAIYVTNGYAPMRTWFIPKSDIRLFATHDGLSR